MRFAIYFGEPEIADYWKNLNIKVEKGLATANEKKELKKLVKTLSYLSTNPKHNSLNSHEIEILTKRYGLKVWESYIENNTPSAGRIFWVYYPPGAITIIGIEPHPNDNKHSYEKITLSSI